MENRDNRVGKCQDKISARLKDTAVDMKTKINIHKRCLTKTAI